MKKYIFLIIIIAAMKVFYACQEPKKEIFLVTNTEDPVIFISDMQVKQSSLIDFDCWSF